MKKFSGFARSLVLISSVFGVFSSSAFALSPPWIVLHNQIQATLGADHCVDVDQLAPVGPNYNLDVHVVCLGKKRAQGLSDFISKTHDFGGIDVIVRVFDYRGNLVLPQAVPTDPDAARDVLRNALRSNRYFDGFEPGNAIYTFFIEFNKCVVQYFADNLADSHNNINQVAADAFREVLGLESISHIRIGAGTSLKACTLRI